MGSVLQRINGQLLAIVAAVILLAGTFVVLSGGEETKTVTAHFSRAVSVYPGSEVRILGVTVGTVKAVVPAGNSVRVDMEYDAEFKVPAEARAVVITPTLVADRFVQLTPAYTRGEVMADGAVIPLEETGVPVELDRIYASLRDLSLALGPNGANAQGSLDTLLEAGATTLRGQGAQGNRMLVDLARAAETFGEGSGDLFATVDQLARFTTVLAANDQFVRAFIADLASVSGQLAAERVALRQLLLALAESVDVVRTFVRDNRDEVSKSLKDLADVMGILAKEKDSLALALEKGPLGLGNLAVAFDQRTKSIGSRVFAGANVDGGAQFLCNAVVNANIPNSQLACQIFDQLLDPVVRGKNDGSARRTSVRPEGAPLTSGTLGTDAPAASLGELLGGQA